MFLETAGLFLGPTPTGQPINRQRVSALCGRSVWVGYSGLLVGQCCYKDTCPREAQGLWAWEGVNGAKAKPMEAKSGKEDVTPDKLALMYGRARGGVGIGLEMGFRGIELIG